MGRTKPTKRTKKELSKKTVPKRKVKRAIAPSFFKNKELWLPALVLLVITTLVFYPSLLNEFVNWDDDRNFYENANLEVLNWDNVKNIFSSHVIGNYNPLTTFTFALERHFFGLDQPFYWHLNNLILHLICCFFAYRICLELGLNWKFALVGALFFAIHPMRVESVAWTTERKDVLFGAFYLSGIFYYIRHLKYKPAAWQIPLITALFILSLFSKIQAVIFPVSLVLIHYLLNKKITRKHIYILGMFFILSIAFGLLGIYFLQFQGSLESNSTFPMGQRIFIGSFSFIIYLVKWIYPYMTSPLYPYPSTIGWMFYVSMIPALGVLGLIYYFFKKNHKHAVFGFMFFIVNIVFLLQILGAGQGFLADRFTYIAYFGLFFMSAYYIQQLALKKANLIKFVYAGLGAYFILFAWMSWKQCHIWKDSASLWTHVIKYYDNTTLPFGNRANHYRDNGMIQEALKDYSEVLRMKPNNEKAYNSRARLYFQNVTNSRDTLILALNDYNKAIELKPDESEYYINRGAVHARLGQINAGVQDMNKGLELDPQNANGYLNRSVLYNNQGKWQSALNDITSYLSLKPYDAQLWFQSGKLKARLVGPNESIADYNRAIQLDPRQGSFYYDRSKVYYSTGNLAQARADLSQAQQRGIQADPSYVQLLQ
jgi:tetratricopeptide (TPR) repeat protein